MFISILLSAGSKPKILYHLSENKNVIILLRFLKHFQIHQLIQGISLPDTS